MMRLRVAALAFAACLSVAAAAAAPAAVAPAALAVAQIVEHNAAARGGLEAWRKIQTMAWSGHVENTSGAAKRLPFMLEQMRPGKTRFEIQADREKLVRIYDGANGWKLRPSAGGRPQVQPYSAEELNFARDAQVIDGPLMDFAARGLALDVEGIDSVEGRKAYRLGVRGPEGLTDLVWVDADTFLELRLDHLSRKPNGDMGAVSKLYRNYQAVEGLQFPLVIETGNAEAKAMDRLVIERIALNPPLSDRAFAKSSLTGGPRNGVTIDTRGALAQRPNARTAQ